MKKRARRKSKLPLKSVATSGFMVILLVLGILALVSLFKTSAALTPVYIDFKPLITVQYATIHVTAYVGATPVPAQCYVSDGLQYRAGPFITPFEMQVYQFATVECNYQGMQKIVSGTPLRSPHEYIEFHLEAPTPYFEVDTAETFWDVTASSSVTFDVNVYSRNGFNSQVTLTLELATGLQASGNINPSSVTPPKDGSAKVRVTVNVPTTIEAKTYYGNQVIGRSSTLTDAYTFALRVNPSAPPTTPVSPTPIQTVHPKVHVGDVRDEVNYLYRSGKTNMFPGGVSSAFVQMALIQESELPYSAGYEIEGMLLDFDIPPKIWDYGPLGKATVEAYGFLIRINTYAVVHYQGKEIYRSPDTGERRYYTDNYGVLQWSNLPLFGYKEIPAKSGVWFELINWNFDPTSYLQKASPGDMVTFTYDWRQEWILEVMWPVAAMGGGGMHVEAYEADIRPIQGSVGHSMLIPPEGLGNQPGLVIGVRPTSITIGTKKGTTQYLWVDAIGYNNFEAKVHFSIENLPAGVSASFDRNDLLISPSGPTNMIVNYNTYTVNARATLTTTSTTKIGSYTPTAVVTGGGVTQKATFALEVVEETEEGEYYITPELHTRIVFTTKEGKFKPSETFLLEGIVETYYHEPVVGVKLHVSSPIGISEDITTDSGGNFQIEIQLPDSEGTFRIKVEATSVPKGYAKPSPRTFNVVVTEEAGILGIPSGDEVVQWLLKILLTAGAAIVGILAPILLIIIIVVIIIFTVIWLLRKGYHAAVKGDSRAS